MSDGMAKAALSKVTGIMSAALAATGLSFFVLSGMMALGAAILGAGGVVIALMTKPVDEESAAAHRKYQLIYGSICGVVCLFNLARFGIL